MKKWTLVFRNTIFRRLLITFLLILLPIYFVGIYIHNRGVQAIHDQITDSVTSQGAFYLEKLDLEINRILSLSQDCLFDENLRRLVYLSGAMTNYEKGQATLNLQHRLNSIKNSSDYIKNVKVCIPTLKYTISANGGANFYDKSEPGKLDALDSSNGAKLTYNMGQLYLAQQYWSATQRQVLYWIEIYLDQSVLAADLDQFYTYPGNISIIYFSASGLTITSKIAGGGVSVQTFDAILKARPKSMGEYNELITLNGKEYSAYYEKSDYLGLVLARYIPTGTALGPLRTYQIWLWIFLALSILIVFLFSFSVYKFIYRPLSTLLDAFIRVESGDFSVKITSPRKDEFGHLYNNFNDMTANLELLIDQVYNQKILAQKAELKQLQTQINPHFLYNSFFSLYSVVRAEDYETALPFIQQLGEYFKYISRFGEDAAPLSSEAEHAQIYANIQLLRFGTKLSVQFDAAPEKYKNLIVPRLIMQPILENAFKYALEGNAGKGILRVSYSESVGYLYITVEDNGKVSEEEMILHIREALQDQNPDKEISGLINIHRRLRLHFSENSGLRAGIGEMGGLKVDICIEIPEGYNV